MRVIFLTLLGLLSYYFYARNIENEKNWEHTKIQSLTTIITQDMISETLQEKTQLEVEIALLSLSLNGNGCKYKGVRPVARWLLHYTNPLYLLSIYPLSGTSLIYGTKDLTS